jgi:hypothetical protein
MSARRADAADPQQSAQEVILGLALSYLASRSLHVATELGIADLLKDGPQGIKELARATQREHNSSRSTDCSECWPDTACLRKSRPDDSN